MGYRRRTSAPADSLLLDVLGWIVDSIGRLLARLWRLLTGRKPSAAPEWTAWLYAKDCPLTKHERDFFRKLQAWAWDRGYDMLANMNLYAVIGCRERGGRGWGAWKKIQAKQIDFVCVDAGGKTVFCLELDDGSHDSDGARKRDAEKDAAFAAAGIPFFRTRGTDRLPDFLDGFGRDRK